jgi:hypothetical protein
MRAALRSAVFIKNQPTEQSSKKAKCRGDCAATTDFRIDARNENICDKSLITPLSYAIL